MESSISSVRPNASERRSLNRRTLLGVLTATSLAAVAGASAGCTPSATAPAAPPTSQPVAKAAPTAPPAKAATQAPAKPTAPPAVKPAPTAPPAKAATQAPAKQAQAVKVKVGVIGGLFDNSFSFIGQSKGIFQNHGVDVEFVDFQNGVTMTTAIVAGEILTGETGIPQIFPAVAAGGALKVIAATKPKLNFIVTSQPEIGGLKDLYDKTVGTGGLGALLHVVMLALMEANKLDPERPKYVNIGPAPQVFQALVAKKVDAGPLTVEWIFPTQEQPGLKVLVDNVGDQLPNYLRLALIARDQDIQSQRATLVNLLKGYSETFRYVPTHREEVVQLAVDRLANDRATAEKRFDLYLQKRLFDPNLAFTPAHIQFVQEMNIKVEQQDAVLPFDRVATLDLIEQVQKEMGTFHWS